MADGDGTQSGASGTQSGTGETTTDGGTTTQTGETTQSGGDTTQTTQTNTEAERAKAEAESFRERMKAADQRAARFEQELKQIRDKDLPEAEKVTRELQEAHTKVEELKQTNQGLALKVAFLSDNTVTWHNPERALKLVDLSKVTIDDDGTVHGMRDALNALAKSDDYLVKKEVKADDKQTPPGTAPGNNGANGTGKPNTAGLTSRFPVMRTRVRPQ